MIIVFKPKTSEEAVKKIQAKVEDKRRKDYDYCIQAKNK